MRNVLLVKQCGFPLTTDTGSNCTLSGTQCRTVSSTQMEKPWRLQPLDTHFCDKLVRFYKKKIYFILTTYTEQRPLREDSQYIYRILWHPEAHCRIQNSPFPIAILSRIIPVNALPVPFLEDSFLSQCCRNKWKYVSLPLENLGHIKFCYVI